jgi:ribonucleoside-diphosphate reductase alpha chain
MTRERLRNRRAAEVVSFEHVGTRWTAGFGFFDSGKIAEIFLEGPRECALADLARKTALLVSLALQHNCPLDTIKHAFNGHDAGPIAEALPLAAEERQ